MFERKEFVLEVYEAIYKRRDIRQFRDAPIDPQVILKILDAAHHAGSVGFMQPWNFIVIKSKETKEKMYQLFLEENAKAREAYEGDTQRLYDSLTLQGIRESPYNIAVTCRHEINDDKPVLGRRSMPEMDLYSTCCAIQNLWLAARAEGIGVGWVSIFEPSEVKKILKIPASVTLVAYLCLGFPLFFDETPLLERVGWRKRLPLKDVVYRDFWEHPDSP
jgi:5,6-dimethylbenzimidazole synthase